MVEKQEIYNSVVKYNGVFPYKDFYKFCYVWLMEDMEVGTFSERKYEEKIQGNSKEIKVSWETTKELTDYFRMDIKVKFHITGMTNVEVNKDGQKIKMNKGEIKITVKGVLSRDYKGKFETNATMKFLRALYEKYIIASRVDYFETYLVQKADEFLNQSKAYLDLEGKR